MLVRAAQYGILGLWNVKNVDSIKIRGLNLWKPSNNDSDYSTFFVCELGKTESLDWVVMRMLATSFELYKGGIDFLFLDEDFLLKNGFNLDEDKTVFNCIHVNIKDVTYYQMRKIIDYSFNQKNNSISYDETDIKTIFDKMSQSEFNEMVDFWHSTRPNKNTNEFVNPINTRYYKGDTIKKEYTGNTPHKK